MMNYIAYLKKETTLSEAIKDILDFAGHENEVTQERLPQLVGYFYENFDQLQKVFDVENYSLDNCGLRSVVGKILDFQHFNNQFNLENDIINSLNSNKSAFVNFFSL